MKTETEKTTTTLDSILSEQELITFNAAKKTWAQATKNTLKNLENMATIGKALNLLYDKGDQKNLKRDAITDMVRSHFKGLDRRERSDYRKLANDYIQIKLFVKFADIKSANPSYLINAWRKAMTEDRAACDFIETQLAGGVDVQGEVISKKAPQVKTTLDTIDTPQVKTTLDTIDTLPLKTGFTNVVTPEPLTVKELTEQIGAVINQVKIAFNTGRFDKEAASLLIIENHLTSCLQHINKYDIEENELLKAIG